jgi:hypothetical protein
LRVRPKRRIAYSLLSKPRYCAPGAFAAADVEHGADRALQVVLGHGDGQRDLAREPWRAADVAVAVPALEVVGVVMLGH